MRTALQRGMGIAVLQAPGKWKCWDSARGLQSNAIAHVRFHPIPLSFELLSPCAHSSALLPKA